MELNGFAFYLCIWWQFFILLGQGGILALLNRVILGFSIAWFLETAAFGAVDCFALISGYVGYHSNFRYEKRSAPLVSDHFFTRLESLFYLPYLCLKLSQRINGLLPSFLS